MVQVTLGQGFQFFSLEMLTPGEASCHARSLRLPSVGVVFQWTFQLTMSFSRPHQGARTVSKAIRILQITNLPNETK